MLFYGMHYSALLLLSQWKMNFPLAKAAALNMLSAFHLQAQNFKCNVCYSCEIIYMNVLLLLCCCRCCCCFWGKAAYCRFTVFGYIQSVMVMIRSAMAMATGTETEFQREKASTQFAWTFNFCLMCCSDIFRLAKYLYLLQNCNRYSAWQEQGPGAGC